MTNEEAIAVLNKELDEISLGEYTYDGLEKSIALEMGIKALEQKPILAKIRAEIEHNAYPIVYGVNNRELGMTPYGILQVLDKYKAESEGI